MPEVQEEILSQPVSQVSNEDSKDQSGTKEGGEKSKFGSWPNFNDPNFDFCKELERLPFPLNLGEVKMSKEQQVRFLKLIYNNQVVFLIMWWGFRFVWLPQAHYPYYNR